ncbi:spore germination protein GerPC [Aquibacillus rhizosphaerae]|uniref:Spore germination protein GerPC n=1 Tax=Aquibacillus rhizosphaerae TaxID=3051431 RepID=A0ABT7LBS4_9BACI|nr:spore germination protein GerPC [Aquibacillus sp. LR5S19]MDL4842869.1 spore germination protein GerPC [Aquibacillus sp. LR5S19]
MNHSNPWYEYVYNLQKYVEQQDKRVNQLEQRLSQVENNQANAKHTTIEKLEYNFDQLKIERLDGTLHIGVSPDDLSKIDDLSLNQQPLSNFQQPHSIKQQTVSQLDSYLSEQGPSFLNQLSNDYNYPVNESYQEMMLNDVRKQLPERVAHYEKNARNESSLNNDKQLSNYIYEQVKSEINYSLQQFFENEKTKGDQ